MRTILLVTVLLLAGCASSDTSSSSSSQPVAAGVHVAKEVGQQAGTLLQPQADVDAPFQLNSTHANMTVVLRATTSGGPVRMTMTLTRQDGASSQTQLSILAPGTPGQQLSTSDAMHDAAAGNYTANVKLDVGANAGYELFWCTDGTGEAPPGNLACTP